MTPLKIFPMKKQIIFFLLIFYSSHTFAQANLIPMGSNGPNALSCSGMSRSNVWYDQDLNSMVFIHRSSIDPTIGYFRFDLSSDTGYSWQQNLGPVYVDLGSTGGRFPLCGIYNPVANTNPLNAYIAFDGLWTDGTGWRGHINGSGPLTGSSYIQHRQTGFPFATYPYNMFIVKNTHEAWKCGIFLSPVPINAYVDTLVISHGTWNAVANDYDFTEQHLHATINPHTGFVPDIDIAFNDDGDIGYVAMIVNSDSNNIVITDSTFYLDVYITTDSGQSWGNPTHLNMQTVVDTLLAHDHTKRYGPAFDLDVVVDSKDKLHILTNIMVSRGFDAFADSGTWGMFDINNVYGCWRAVRLDNPMTYRGVFGLGTGTDPELIEYNRPFASRNWDGTKLFFSWFDTDTNVFVGLSGNQRPDLHSIGYDVDAELWTNPMNLTAGTISAGQCTFGNGSYYVIDKGANVFSIPTIVQTLASPLLTGQPTTFNYLSNANVDMNLATHPSITYVNMTTCIDTFSISTGIRKIDYPNTVQMFPNPASDRITLRSAYKMDRLIISDINGKTVFIQEPKMREANVSFSNFPDGVYFITIECGDLIVHKKVLLLKD